MLEGISQYANRTHDFVDQVEAARLNKHAPLVF